MFSYLDRPSVDYFPYAHVPPSSAEVNLDFKYPAEFKLKNDALLLTEQSCLCSIQISQVRRFGQK